MVRAQQMAPQLQRRSPRTLQGQTQKTTQQQQTQQQQQQQKQQQQQQQPTVNRALTKPPKQPRPPKMARTELNWDEAAFADIQSRYAPPASQQPPVGETGSTKHWPRTLPEHSTATFAQLLLLHGAGWPSANMWQRWQAAHEPGSLAKFSHVKSGVEPSPGMPGFHLISRTKLKASVDSRWGDISLVEATLQGLEEVLLRCPHVTHVGLASGHDVPVQLIKPGLLLPGVSLIGLFEFGPQDMDTLQATVQEQLLGVPSVTPAQAAAWRDALTFHHQWVVLAREHVAALVHHKADVLKFGRLTSDAQGLQQLGGAGMAPDEFILITALKQLGLVRSVQRVQLQRHMQYPPGTLLNAYPTSVVFPAESSPHPVLWTDMDTKVLCQLEEARGRKNVGLMSLSDCQEQAAVNRGIYFRKVQIRQTDTQLQAWLLSRLDSMWAGQGHSCSDSVTAHKEASGGSKGGAEAKAGSGSNAARKKASGGSNAAGKKASGGSNEAGKKASGGSKGSSKAKPGSGKRRRSSSEWTSIESCGTTAVPPGVVGVIISKLQRTRKRRRSN